MCHGPFDQEWNDDELEAWQEFTDRNCEEGWPYPDDDDEMLDHFGRVQH